MRRRLAIGAGVALLAACGGSDEKPLTAAQVADAFEARGQRVRVESTAFGSVESKSYGAGTERSTLAEGTFTLDIDEAGNVSEATDARIPTHVVVLERDPGVAEFLAYVYRTAEDAKAAAAKGPSIFFGRYDENVVRNVVFLVFEQSPKEGLVAELSEELAGD